MAVGDDRLAPLSVSASTKDGAGLVSASNLELTESVELTLDLRGGASSPT